MKPVRLVDRNWGAELQKAIQRSSSELRFVSPFIRDSAIKSLLEGHKPGVLEVVTRFNMADFGSGVSDISSIRRILDAGGRVRGLRDLHSKLYLFGNVRAAVTSANLTSKGLWANHEFGCVSDDPSFVLACQRYFARLWKSASPDVTPAQLDAWEAILEDFLSGGGRPDVAATLPDFGTRFPAYAQTRAIPGAEGWPAESGQIFVKLFGEGTNRAVRSQTILSEVERSGCHWACSYPAKRRPRSVRDGDTLLMARLVRDPNDALIFGRAIGRRHEPGRDDASVQDIKSRRWKTKWPHYVRVHHAEFVAGTLANGISLGELMDQLGSDSFATTQLHASDGVGNVNPRLSLMQQAAVLLSTDGASWATQALERAFADRGRLSYLELGELVWPAPI